ncbi:hypothetical protein DDZ18_12495 [Marinicauda salina]|uniref:DUF2382 domain-containing protein n=1 Tax=Marinicauda salina TaxID=2135793 RepID=A0A2U2BRE7_9PROT|nr:hypothetical protein [Marinicauda salina]PWE16580.1 hypothetical protein DDZ18_12495 [Marinicauda salina]
MSDKTSKAAMLALLGASLGIAPAQAGQSPDGEDGARPAVDLGAAQEALDSRQIKIADPEARQHKVTDEESRQIKIGEPETRQHKVDAESMQYKLETPQVDPEALRESRQFKVESPESRQIKIEEPESRQIKIDGVDGEAVEDGAGGGPHDAGGGPHR